MIHSQNLVRIAAALGAALMCITSRQAAAVNMSVVVATIYQVGNGAGVSMGHAVSATSNLNRLVVGGTFTASCASPQMLPATGSRTLTAESYIGGTVLTTTVPETVPTIINMPGYNSVPAGATLDCTYAWTAKAVESQFSIGAGGVGITTGGGERNDGSAQLFTMKKPGANDGDARQRCSP